MLFARLAKILAPPNFLLMPSIGVDISDTSLKYVECPPRPGRSGRLNIKNHGSSPIEKGALEKGIVNDVGKLSSSIAAMREATGATMVRLSLPEERGYIFETEIDKSTHLDKIHDALEFKLEENVPLSPREALFDYEVRDDPTEQKNWRVLVTAYARETIESYYEACRAGGVMPLSFEVEAQAVARSVIPFGDMGTHLVVDLGKARTGLGIVHKGLLMYTATLEMGGDDISEALRVEIGEVMEAELIAIKNNQGLVSSSTMPELTEAIRKVIDTIIKELNIRLQYWNTENRERLDRQIQSVIICGGGANIKGLPRYLTESLGLDTRRANVWTNVLSLHDTVPPIEQRYAYSYATAIGLALAAYHYI